VHDTWATRELPVLSATVSLLEESYMVTVSDIAGRTELDAATVARSLEALDPVYVDFRKTTTGGDPTFWYVLKVTPQARQAVGQWPTADSFVTRLAEELSAAAAQEEDAERKGLISYAARLIGDTLREAAVRAAGQVLAPAVPAPPPAPPAATAPAESSPG
jgi:predicted transcriptional regulator